MVFVNFKHDCNTYNYFIIVGLGEKSKTNNLPEHTIVAIQKKY
jgi:hypothetical protein